MCIRDSLIPWENVVRIGIDVVLVQLPQPETAKPHRGLRPAKQEPEKWQQELAAYQNELESGQTVRISYDKQKIEEQPLVEGAKMCIRDSAHTATALAAAPPPFLS